MFGMQCEGIYRCSYLESEREREREREREAEAEELLLQVS